MKLLLSVRRALIETTWERIINGVKNYKAYCQKAGIEGSSYVLKPQTFFDDGIYAEELEFKPAEDPSIAVARNRVADRFARAREAGSRIGIEPYALESVEAFETRIRLESAGLRGDVQPPVVSDEISSRIRSLTDKFRIAK